MVLCHGLFQPDGQPVDSVRSAQLGCGGQLIIGDDGPVLYDCHQHLASLALPVIRICGCHLPSFWPDGFCLSGVNNRYSNGGMILIRSMLFNLLFYSSTAVLAVALLPCLLRGDWARAAGKFWGWYTSRLLYIAGLSHQISGQTHKSRQVIYAVKHQSAWETLVLYWELDAPVIVLKRELLRLPILGWFFLRSGCIAVDRKAGMAALKMMRQQAVIAASSGRSVLIFPQGTRVATGQSAPYQIGVFSLYQATGLDVVPVALNSGRFWARNGFIKRPGVIAVRFLPVLGGGLPRAQFMTSLEEAIETEMMRLDG